MAIINSMISGTIPMLTVPEGKRYAITNILICNNAIFDPINPTDGTTNFDIHFIPSGEPKSFITMVINNMILPAEETFTFDSERIILEAGDYIVIEGDAPNVLSATISYWEV